MLCCNVGVYGHMDFSDNSSLYAWNTNSTSMDIGENGTLSVNTTGMISCCNNNLPIISLYSVSGTASAVISKGKFAALDSPLKGLEQFVTGKLSAEKTEVVHAPYLNEAGEVTYKDVTLKVVEVTE